MKHYIAKQYDPGEGSGVEFITSSRAGLVEMPHVGADGDIETVRIYGTAFGEGSAATFNVALNGVNLFSGGGRPVLEAGDAFVEITGLSIPIVHGDDVRLDMPVVAGSVQSAITLEYIVEDGVSAGGVVSVVAGDNITVDDTDPANPIVSSTDGGGGGVNDFKKRWAYGAAPDLSTFTRHGSSVGSSVEDADGDVILTGASGGSGMEAWYKSLPSSGDWAVTAAFYGRALQTETFGIMGMVLWDSVADKSIFWGIIPIFTGGVGSLTGTKNNGYAGTYQGAQPGDYPSSSYPYMSPHTGLWFVRIRKVGTDIFLDSSIDGIMWYTNHANYPASTGGGGWITPDKAGIVIGSSSGYCRFKSFEIST